MAKVNEKVKEQEILDMMKRNGYSREEAEEIWNWDNSDEETEETKKASEEWKKMSRTAHDARTIKPNGEKRKAPTRAENPTKQNIINALFEALEFLDGASEIEITNKEKYIHFSMNGNKYEINLIQKRPPKVGK